MMGSGNSMSEKTNASFLTMILLHLNMINKETLQIEFSTNVLLVILSVFWLLYRLKQHLAIPLNALVEKYHTISIPHNPTKISLDYIDDTSVLIRWENQSYNYNNKKNEVFVTKDNESSSSKMPSGSSTDTLKNTRKTNGLNKTKKKSATVTDTTTTTTTTGEPLSQEHTEKTETVENANNCSKSSHSDSQVDGTFISHYFLYINNTLIGQFFNNPNNNNLYTSCSIKNLKINHFYKIDLVSVNKNGFRNQPLSVIVNLNNLKNEHGKSQANHKTKLQNVNRNFNTQGTFSASLKNNIHENSTTAKENIGSSTLHWKTSLENDLTNGSDNASSQPGFSSSTSYSSLTSMHSLEKFSLEQLKEILIGAQEELHGVIKYREELFEQYKENELTLGKSIEENKKKYGNYQELKKQQKAEIIQLENQKNNIDFQKTKLTNKLIKLKTSLDNVIKKNEDLSRKVNEIKDTKPMSDLINIRDKLLDSVSLKETSLKEVQKEMHGLVQKLNDLKKKLSFEITDPSSSQANGSKFGQTSSSKSGIASTHSMIDQFDKENMNDFENEEEKANDDDDKEKTFDSVKELDMNDFNENYVNKSNGTIDTTAKQELQKLLIPNHYTEVMTKSDELKTHLFDTEETINSLNEKCNNLNRKLEQYTEYGITLTNKLIDLQKQQHQQQLKQQQLQQQQRQSQQQLQHSHPSPPMSSNIPLSGAQTGTRGGAGTLVLHDPTTYEDNQSINLMRPANSSNQYLSYLLNNYQQQQQQQQQVSGGASEFMPLSTSSSSLLLPEQNNLYGSKNSNLWNQQPPPTSLNSQTQPLNIKSSLNSLSSLYAAGVNQQSQQQQTLPPSSAPSSLTMSGMPIPSSLESQQQQSLNLPYYPMQTSLSNSYSQSSFQPTPSGSAGAHAQSSVWNDSSNQKISPSSAQASLHSDAQSSNDPTSFRPYSSSSRFEMPKWSSSNR